MKLSDVRLMVVNGEVVICRVLANGKVKNKIDVTQEFIDIVARMLDNTIITTSNGDVYLTAIRKASKGQLVEMKTEKKIKEFSRQQRGEKAIINLQKMLKALYMPNPDRLQMIRELEKLGVL